MLLPFIPFSIEYDLRTSLSKASNYDEWLSIAKELDKYMLLDRLEVSLRIFGNATPRAGLIRNLGGIANSNLYSKSYSGTKKLIEEYLDVVCEALEFVYLSITPNGWIKCDGNEEVDLYKLHFEKFCNSNQYFSESLQTLGRSALLLTGGFSLGMYHLGVVKALYLQNFLPDVICGIDIGSFVAALVCCVTPENLAKILMDPIRMINFDAFKRIPNEGSLKRKIGRYIRYGHILNIKTLESLARSNIGDITFFEAYSISKKILNITVSLGANSDIVYVLNYLTAPDIVVWSAACASASECGLYGDIQILRKTPKGVLLPWNPSEIQKLNKLCAPFNLQSRLASLFNVNHLIISKVAPYRISVLDTLFPRLPVQASAPLSTKVFGFIYSEIKHLLFQFSSLGLLPSFIEQFSAHFHPVDGLYERVGLSGGGSELALVVSPQLSIEDASRLFSIPTAELLMRTLLKGEQTIWPEIAKVAVRMKTERLLCSIIERLKAAQKTFQVNGDGDLEKYNQRGRLLKSNSEIFAAENSKKQKKRFSSVH